MYIKISNTIAVSGYNAPTGHNYERSIFQLKHHKDTQIMIKFKSYHSQKYPLVLLIDIHENKHVTCYFESFGSGIFKFQTSSVFTISR